MFRYLNCPHCRQTQQCQQCGFIGQLVLPTQRQSSTIYMPLNPSLSFNNLSPLYYPMDPRIIQHGIVSHVSERLQQIAERHVHFDPPSRTAQRICADGTYDVVHETSRLTRRSLPTPTPDTPIQTRPHPRPRPEPPVLHSILRPAAAAAAHDLDLRPVQPTIYLITFSADTLPNRTRNVDKLLDMQIPRRNPPIPHLYTIDARNFTPPPPHICDRYSGISPVVQDAVMQDTRARHAVRDGVQALVAFGLRERGKGGGGRREVSMSVCCHMGTHRSVSVAEMIAQGVKAEVGRLGVEEGVRVVVRHVHRMKGRADPF